MSSSVNFPDWTVFTEREEVVLDTELVSPAAEVASILRTRQAALHKVQQVIENERMVWLDVLAQEAVFVVHLAIVLDRYESIVSQASTQEVHPLLDKSYRSLRIVKNQMLDALQNAGLDIEVPLGKPFDEVAEVVRVDGWRHQKDFTSEIVAEVMEPIVRYEGTVVRTGRVVMGAPLEEDTDFSSIS